MAAAYTAPGAYTADVNTKATAVNRDLPGHLWFQMKPPGTTTRRVRIHSSQAPRRLNLGWSITGEFLENATDGWGVYPPDIQATVPYDASWISAQQGAPAGLWTHTPVDWRGNEGLAKPGPWPANAFGAVPPNGARP
jgi:hypothetical protein